MNTQSEHPRHPLCTNGCQYAKDVDVWPDHQCVGPCWYTLYRLDEEPPPSDKEKQG